MSSIKYLDAKKSAGSLGLNNVENVMCMIHVHDVLN